MGKINSINISTHKWPKIATIMVVDDDDNWCFISKKLLAKVGFKNEILVARNGLEAFKKLQDLAAQNEKLPDLILLDIKMPVMNGFEFLEAVTESAELDLSNTKIYVCSSSVHPKDKEKANFYAISGFITKPLTQETLEEILT